MSRIVENTVRNFCFKLLLILAVAGIMRPAPAAAAAFDCAKATTAVERQICVDPNLSRLDEQQAAAFTTARSRSPNPDVVLNEQRAFLRRRAACDNSQCILTVMQQRLAELTEGSSDAQRQQLVGQQRAAAEARLQQAAEAQRNVSTPMRQPVFEIRLGVSASAQAG